MSLVLIDTRDFLEDDYNYFNIESGLNSFFTVIDKALRGRYPSGVAYYILDGEARTWQGRADAGIFFDNSRGFIDNQARGLYAFDDFRISIDVHGHFRLEGFNHDGGVDLYLYAVTNNEALGACDNVGLNYIEYIDHARAALLPVIEVKSPVYIGQRVVNEIMADTEWFVF